MKAKESAEISGRITANIEDQIRIANELIRGLEIFTCIKTESESDQSESEPKAEELKTETDFEIIDKKREILVSELENGIKTFAKNILDSERNIVCNPDNKAVETLMSFLMSFASRSATRERLNIFATNYDRVIEFGAELAGIHLID